MTGSDPPLPRLPSDLNDPVALDNWYCTWNEWIAHEAVKRNWPWLKPMTPAMLHEIVEGEKKRRADTSSGPEKEELATARGDLNVLEAHLRATDSQYEAKRRLLVPILQPIFSQISPSNWKSFFEQAYARVQVPVESPTQEQQRELAEGRQALTDLEGRLTTQDAAYEAKKALLVPILKPIFEQLLPPSKWATAFEQAYAGVRLPADNAALTTPAIVSPTKASAASWKKLSHGSMTVLLYELTSHPGEVGISKIDPPVVDGAFFLDFSQPLRVISRRCFGISNIWIGRVTELGVPVVHQLGVPVAHDRVRTGDFLVYMHRTDPRFSDIRALWRTRHPSNRTAPGVAGAGFKIVADFAVQFPQGC
jgi:hypothetical protein